jgi:hypothetical protein
VKTGPPAPGEKWATSGRPRGRRAWGLHRDTIRKALNSDEPPVYQRTPAGSKLDPFKDEICRLLADHPKLPGGPGP